MRTRQEHLSGFFDRWKKKGRAQAAPTGIDLYAILEVDPGASTEDIRAAYRRLARLYHPDVTPGNAEAYQRFVDISRAHDILADEQQRAAYDRSIGVAAKAAEKEEAVRPPTSARGLSTFILTPEEIEREKEKERKKKARAEPPWDILFGEPERGEAAIYEVFQPSPRPAPPTGAPWDVLFPSRIQVTFPSRERLLQGVQKLPLDTVWTFIRENRTAPGFLDSRTMVVGPVAGSGTDPVEADLAELTGASFDEIASFAEQKGLQKAWRHVLGPLAEQAVLAIESLKPSDIPGMFYVDWDPSGRMLELLYTEGSA